MTKPKVEKLTYVEQETIINYNREETIAEVYTHDDKLKSIFKIALLEFPEKCKYIESNRFGGQSYEIPKSWIKIKLPNRISEKTRIARSARMKKLRQTPN